MSLRSVKMSEEVWLTCLTHALTTEKEEIMGLLLGDIQDIGGNPTALIWGASPQMRSDRRKDRVETNPELLAAATAQADRMTLTTGRKTRVIGWYHSHPHITVLPSHVDVRTQAMYQLLDSGFIGLIFSCFSEDAQKVGRIQVIAFQSLDGKAWNASPVAINVDSSWSSSDNALLSSGSGFPEGTCQDTGDSRLAKASEVRGRSNHEDSVSHVGVTTPGKQKTSGNSLVAYSPEIRDRGALDSSELSDSIEEALRRSNMDMSGAEYMRKEVAFDVLPANSLLKLDHPLSSFAEMQHVLFDEELSAYKQAILNCTQEGRIHPLTYVHHTSTYQASLCKLVEYCLSPAINALQDRLMENELQLSKLTEEANTMEKAALERESERTSSGSPQQRSFHGSRGNLAAGQASLDSPSARSPSDPRRKAY